MRYRHVRPLPILLTVITFLATVGEAFAGDPCVLGFLNAKLNYTTADSVRFEVEVQNFLGFPAAQYGSYFLITPIGYPGKAERFDIPEFTFPPMTKVNVGMSPQYWRPKQAGLHRVEFFSHSPDDIDTTNNYARWNFFVAYGYPLLDRSGVSALVNQHIAANLQLDPLTDNAFVTQTPLHGARITSRDSTEFDMVLDSTQWFAWIETNKYARFGKDNWFVVVDRVDSTVQSYHTDWYPRLNGSPYPFTLGLSKDADLVYGTSVETENVPSLALISETDTSTRQPRACAILVTGDENDGSAFDRAFDNDINTMRNNLTMEKLGPRIHPDDVVVLRYPSPDEVREELLKLKGKCSTVYFVYSGHGGRWSMLLQDFYFYENLLVDLDQIGADSINIFIDACHSGALIDALDTLSGVLENTHVTAVTACSADTLAYSSKIITGTGDTITLGTYAWAFAKYFGDPDADMDGVPGTSFAETYAWISGIDPNLSWSGRPLMDEMRPRLRVKPKKSPVALLDRNAAADVARDWIRNQPGVDSTRSVGYLLQQPLQGVRVTGRDSTEFSSTLDSLYWFGWLDDNKYGGFGKAVTYFTINRVDGTLAPDTTDWYPSLNGIPYPGTTLYPASRDMILGSPRFALPVPTFNTISDPDTTSPRDGKSCAVLVAGGDYFDGDWSRRHFAAVDMLRDELLRERRGIRVDGADILRYTNPTPTQLRTGLQSLKGNYDRVFFYYSGNGTPDAMQVRLPFSYRELVKSLDSVGTDAIDIVIDSPFSGSIIGDIINAAPIREGVKLSVLTSSAADAPAYGEMLTNNTSDTLAIPAFSRAFSRWHGAAETDTDGESGTSLAEIFLRIHNQFEKPGWSEETIWLVQRPRIVVDAVEAYLNRTFRISDIDAALNFTRMPDSSARLHYRVRALDTDFPRADSISLISPARMWTFDLRDNSSPFELDLSFITRLGMDSINPPPHARLGLVRRDSSGQVWRRHEPVHFDRITGLISTEHVRRFSDWAIAYVRNRVPESASAALTTGRNTESPPVIPVVVDGDEGDTFVFSVVAPPAKGTARIEGNTLRYMPFADFTGKDSFTFRATDEAGDWVNGTATVNVVSDNARPVAADDDTSVTEDTPAFLDVLNNDTDADEDPLIILSTGGAAHGSISIAGDTLIQYIPDENYAGFDTFDYTISDGRGETASATVTVRVLPINDAPESFTRLAPVDAVIISGENAELRWHASADVEGEVLTYVISLSSDNRRHIWMTSDTVRIVTRSELGLADGTFVVDWSIACTDGIDTIQASDGPGQFTFDGSTGGAVGNVRPEDIRILGNHPEPFTGNTAISIALGRETGLRVSIHSFTGQQLAVLADGRFVPGTHTVRWDGRAGDGHPLPSGIYVAMLHTPGRPPLIRRLTLLR